MSVQVLLVTTAGAAKVLLRSKTDADTEVQGKGTSHQLIKCQVGKLNTVSPECRYYTSHHTHTHTLTTMEVCVQQTYETSIF